MAKAETITERALQVHLAEYDAIRSEINLQLGLQHQLLNYALALIAGTATISGIGNPSISSKFPAVFLVSSLLMTAISWALLEASLQINNLGSYIYKELSPKIQTIVGGQNAPEYLVLRWEDAKVRKSPRLILHGIVATGKFAITFVSSIAFIVIFVFLKIPNQWSRAENILFWIALSTAILLPLGGLINLPFILHMSVAKKRK